jgi:hypothetical protein
MGRTKKTSKIIEDANVRLASIKSIDANLSLGNNLGVLVFNTKIEEVKQTLEEYNTALSLADEKANIYRQKEKELKDLHERMLIGVAAVYGKDSNEYEKAGGTKKSERKKPERKDKKTS